MAIEIYDKAARIRKGEKTYFFVKGGSKNCYTTGGQRVVGDDFRGKYLMRDARDSHWSCIASGKADWNIWQTRRNCPTSSVYGRIRFGNKKNIALALHKMRTTDYATLDDEQKANVDRFIARHEDALRNGEWKAWNIDLDKLFDEAQKTKHEVEYCGKTYALGENEVRTGGYGWWNLDNL